MYKHGVYTVLEGTAQEVLKGANAPVYVGTAPVHTVLGGSGNVNKPVRVSSFEQAKALFGYRDDWAAYTLCEAMYAHFTENAVGPIVLINVLDVKKHKEATPSAQTATPASGKIVLTGMRSAVLDSLKVGSKAASAYLLSYDDATGRLSITETSAGSLGTNELEIFFDVVAPSQVDDEDLVGIYDGEGTSTGIQAIRDVYQLTGYIPGTILCPGFSQRTAVREAMLAMSQKANGHWDNFIYTDIPLASGETTMSLSGAAAWKTSSGYNAPNEKIFFPMWKTLSGKIYHLSVLFAVNMQILQTKANGVPYQTASNTALPAGQAYYGADRDSYLPDEEAVNKLLNANGITSVAFTAGAWKLWGAHSAAYDSLTDTGENVADTRRGMLNYLGNRFQGVYGDEVDIPISRNRIAQIAAQENEYIGRLISMGELLYGKCSAVINAENKDQMKHGDFQFVYEITTAPLSKSLTMVMTHTDAGLATFFEEDA
jgi:hypothetical protein